MPQPQPPRHHQPKLVSPLADNTTQPPHLVKVNRGVVMSSDPDQAMNPTSGPESDGRSDSDSDNDLKPTTNNNIQQNGTPQPAPVSHSTASSSSYLAAVAARSGALPKPTLLPKSYSIEPLLTIPHSTQVNAFAAPPCFTHVYSGGADGFVRRHAMSALNSDRKGWEANQGINLYAKPLGGVDGRQAVLRGYWENEEPASWVADTLANAGPQASESRAATERRIRWGPKTASFGSSPSPVHSLAVHSQELWGLSGTAHGSINLWTVRHDEGQIRHCFAPSETPTSGHRRNAAISALLLDREETAFLSGGWDARIVEWDLNTGAAARAYNAHIGQISSLAWRPLDPPPRSAGGDGDAEMAEAEVGSPDDEDAGVAAALTGSAAAANGVDDGDADADGEEDADGEVDEEAAAPASGGVGQVNGGFKYNLPSKDAASKAVPVVGAPGSTTLPELSKDVFLSSSVDGEVMLWDRRIKTDGTRGGVRKLAGEGTHSGWCSSAIWSTDPNQLLVGRRNGSTSLFDLRHSSLSNPAVLSLQLPSSAGPVTALCALPSGRHVVAANQDVLRVWDLDKARKTGGREGARVVVGAGGDRGGRVSALGLSGDGRWLVSAGGNRGWEGVGSETLVIHEVKGLL